MRGIVIRSGMALWLCIVLSIWFGLVPAMILSKDTYPMGGWLAAALPWIICSASTIIATWWIVLWIVIGSVRDYFYEKKHAQPEKEIDGMDASKCRVEAYIYGNIT